METIKAENFVAFPLSDKTKSGLFEAGYKHPTQIQKDSIGLALKGFDVVGAAKTGSGKTLAFVLPLLEILEREKWSKVDGLGALIITPTRELAYQIFEVIKKVGKEHDFSLGLVIGGKDLKFEWNRLHVCNIMITTPGRLLQHMDKNHYFSADNLKLLVLDEADRMLDMGFAETMNSIFKYLPREKQTLLFSATQTKVLKDLARLNLKDPVYVSVHENASEVTPEHLVQSYVECDLHQKLNILWSFLKSHQHNKIIVFFSTCKQTNFVYELFGQMKLKTTFLALYGTLHQLRRMDVYDEFCRKQNAILLATDVASRGLDFPDVNWVLQFDCPEDSNAYIHRVGRTARYKKGGESLLFLLPSEEEGMLEQLQARKIPINKIEINPSRVRSIDQRAAALCAGDLDLKERAQRCFKTYLKSIYFMKNKQVFDVTALDLEAYAHSLGLEVSPRMRFFEKDKSVNDKMKQLRVKEQAAKPKRKPAPTSEDEEEAQSAVKAIASSSRTADEDSGDDLMVLKRKVTYDGGDDQAEETQSTVKLEHVPKKRLKVLSKESQGKKLLKRMSKLNSKKRFDGDSDDDLSDAEYDFGADYNVDYAKEKLSREDDKDKKAYRLVVRKRTMDSKMRAKMDLIDEMEAKAKKLGVKLTGKEDDEEMEEEPEGGDQSADSQSDAERGEHGEEDSDADDSGRSEESEQSDDEVQLKSSAEMEQTQRYIDELPDPDQLYSD